MLDHRNGQQSPCEEVVQWLEENLPTDWTVWVWKLNTMNLGLPHNRSRIFICGRNGRLFGSPRPEFSPENVMISRPPLRSFLKVDAPAFDKNSLTDKEKDNLWHFMEKLEEARPGMDDWAVACLDITRSFSGVWTPPCRFDDTIVCLTTSNHKIWLQSVSAPWISRFLLPEERASIQGLDPAMVSLLPTAGARVTAMGNAMSLPAVGTAIAFTLQGLTGKPDVR
eukprot:4759742-Pyramimonas_sp.AAC.1